MNTRIACCLSTVLLAAGLWGCGGSSEEAAPAPPAPQPAEKAVPSAPPGPGTMPMPSGITGEIQEKMIEAAAAQAGMDADVEFQGDGMTFKASNTEVGAVNLSTGAQAKLPANMPEDVPVYAGLALNMVNEVAEESLFMVMGSSADSIDTIAAFYKEQAEDKGWTLATENVVPGQAHVLMYEKGDRKLQVMLGPAPTGGTQVTMNTGKQ